MRFKAIFPIQTLCMCIDSVPVSAQVTLLMTSSPSFPISGIIVCSNDGPESTDLDLFYGKVKFGNIGFSIGKK